MIERIEKRLRVIQEIGFNISSNLKMYSCLSHNSANCLFDASPNFFAFCRFNFYAMAVIQLDMLLSKDILHNEIGIRKLLNILKSYSDKDASFICESSNKILEEQNELIRKINKDRKKVFAHQDKEYAIDHKIDICTNYNDLSFALTTVQKIINLIGDWFNKTDYFIENFDAEDIVETEIIINLYEKYEKEIDKMELLQKK